MFPRRNIGHSQTSDSKRVNMERLSNFTTAHPQRVDPGTPYDHRKTPFVMLACERCKRRKIKCGRTLPACSNCSKKSEPCTYPTLALKPGPRPGAPQRKKIRRVDGHESSRPCGSSSLGRDWHIVSNSLGDDGTVFTGNSGGRPTSNFNQSQTSGSQFSDTFPLVLQTQSLPHASIILPEINKNASKSPTLSNLLHFSHDPMPHLEPQASESDQMVGRWRGAETVCIDLEISPDIFPQLLSAYFENMTAFSLFHRPTFGVKVSSISSAIQQRALLASMFAISARFIELGQNRLAAPSKIHSYGHFRKIAEESVDEALRECLDDSPSLCLLQALILTTFQQLANGVRGRSWRAIHTCVSIAYDLQLHLIDKNADGKSQNDTDPTLLEEKRRAWWAIWEFDVFASTIRKLPTAIDWANNETWLPIDDEMWFNGNVGNSCILDPDPAVAWKALEISGNHSARAWFITVNALMRCAHIASIPQAYSRSSRLGGTGTDATQETQSNLDILANSLYCLSSALPSNLSYAGEFLNFSTGSSLQADSAKLSIWVMIQLSRLMFHHLRVFNSTCRQLGMANSSSVQAEEMTSSNALVSLDKAAWNVYLAAASEIVNIVRNSSPKHVRYVNPFLSSTIWLAATAQIVSHSIGPPLMNRRVAASNLDLLQKNLDSYVSFWGISCSLQQKLNVLEAKLETIKTQGANSNETELRESHAPRGMDFGVKGTQQPGPARSVFVFDGAVAAEHLATIQPASNPSSSNPDSSSFNVWSGSQTFNFGHALVPDLSVSDMWDYGLDDLLVYGGGFK